VRSPRRTAASVATVLGLATGIVGCSDDSKPAVCSDIDALQDSVQSLRDVSLEQGALTEIRSDLTTISTQFDTFTTDAKGQYATEVSAVRSAVDTLSTAVTGAKEGPTATTLAAVGTAARSVADATKELADAVSGTC
jgi:hypothetical protein